MHSLCPPYALLCQTRASRPLCHAAGEGYVWGGGRACRLHRRPMLSPLQTTLVIRTGPSGSCVRQGNSLQIQGVEAPQAPAPYTGQPLSPPPAWTSCLIATATKRTHAHHRAVRQKLYLISPEKWGSSAHTKSCSSNRNPHKQKGHVPCGIRTYQSKPITPHAHYHATHHGYKLDSHFVIMESRKSQSTTPMDLLQKAKR